MLRDLKGTFYYENNMRIAENSNLLGLPLYLSAKPSAFLGLFSLSLRAELN